MNRFSLIEVFFLTLCLYQPLRRCFDRPIPGRRLCVPS